MDSPNGRDVSVGKALACCAVFGALYGGVAGYLAIVLQYAPALAETVSNGKISLMDIMTVTVLGYASGLPAGFFMGLVGGLGDTRMCWVYGGLVGAGASNLVSSFNAVPTCLVSYENLLLLITLPLCGAIISGSLYHENTQLPAARWVSDVQKRSPLTRGPAWRRGVLALGVPLVLMTVYLWAMTGPTFWQHRAYIGRMGLLPTWLQSYTAVRRQGAPRLSCQSNMKQIAMAMAMYRSDSEGLWPVVASGGGVYGWADAIIPYQRVPQAYQCPEEFLQGQLNPRRNDFTDFWYNARLSGMEAAKLKRPSFTIALGEGNDLRDATDARYNHEDLPEAWKQAPSPATRHLEGANYAFADSHVKWLKPGTLTGAYGTGFRPF